MRTLGDFPGLYDYEPNPDYIPIPSILEVDSTGALTAQDAGIGDITQLGSFSGDPFSMAHAQQLTREQVSSEGGGRDPMASSHLPTGGGAPVTSTSTDAPVSDDGVYDPHAHSAPTTTASVDGFDDEQLQNAAVIAEVGREVGASDRDIQIAFMTAIVESGMRNLDYGDRDSIGMFQQRDAWGSREDRLDPHSSALMFFQGGKAGQEGLLDIPNREKRGMGELAQDVQVSAFPDRYAEHEAEAAAIFKALGSSKPTKIIEGGFEGKDPYDTFEHEGKTLDYLTAAALEQATDKFGGTLPITQGSHNHSVAASGNTHDGGGVIDIIVDDGRWDEAVVALRKVGFAAWDRKPEQGPWPRHIHAVLVGHEKLSPQAAQQVTSYLNNDNALVGSAPDDGPRDWVNRRFSWNDVVGDPNKHLRDKARSTALGHLGTPFKWGGEDYTGVDRGGFIRSVYKDLGVELPKDAVEIASKAEPLKHRRVDVGDLVAWEDEDGGETRLGVYLGHDTVASTSGPGSAVQMDLLGDIGNLWGVPLTRLLGQEPAAKKPAEKKDPFTAPPSTDPPASWGWTEQKPTYATPAPTPPKVPQIDYTDADGQGDRIKITKAFDKAGHQTLGGLQE